MARDPRRQSGYMRHGPADPALPVILSVPHAGRDYPAELLAALRVPRARIEMLEDRHADLLVGEAVAAGATVYISTRPRSWIDLNRHEREIDPGMIEPPPDKDLLIASGKVRGGLGLIPRRVAGAGELWRGPITADELERRLADHHRPWHDALARSLVAARRRFGAALLIDCHSMPPLPGRDAAAVVLGDRHGASAAYPLVETAAATVARAGLSVQRNAPYAGGHTLDRHGRPADNIHAIQIEIDRRTYLAPDLMTPGPGVTRIARLIADITISLTGMLRDEGLPQAAE